MADENLKTPPVPAPALQNTPPEAPVSQDSSIAPRLRTLKSDAEESIKSGETTLVSATVQAQEARLRQAATEPPEKPKGIPRVAMIGGIVTLVAIATSISVYFFTLEPEIPITTQTQSLPTPIIIAETQKRFDVTNTTGRQVAEIISREKAAGNIKLGAIENLVLTITTANGQQILSAPALLSRIAAHVPDSLNRALEDNFFLGLYQYSGTEPFIIFKITSYEQAYASMLSWEKFMLADLSSLAGTMNVSSTSPLSIPQGFRDEVVKNKDVRAIRDQNGKILFLYSFLDTRTLIMAISENSISEAIRRLSNVRVVN